MVQSLAEAIQISDDCRIITTGTPPFTIVHTNKAWSELTGYKFTEVANRTSGFLQGPHTEKLALQELRVAVHNGLQTKVRVINYTKSGDPFHNTLDVIPLKDKRGELTHYCGVLAGEPVADNSVPRLERTQPVLPALLSEEETRESQDESVPAVASINASTSGADTGAIATAAAEPPNKRIKHELPRLANAINNQKDAVVLTQATPPFAITHVNQPWCEMCGYSLEEVEGLTNSFLQGPETDQGLLDELMSSVRRGEPASARLVNYKKNGVRFVNQLQVKPLYNEDDEIEHLMAMLHEVDETVI
uniref:PAS domain-containing protein n=1 Tax=Coccolithus braarudii TaxID=221442 RepID=A0A7S0PV59_9EUKA|mmetsp:Transcript_15130/g.32890  ORF Transcript_15130/g.32890 Transcript_15130/m.32890 type:complete len:304 (+) Transcript_15130:234-1145(+)